MISDERIDKSEGINFNKEEFVIITILKNLDLNINPMFVMDVMILVWLYKI